MSTHTQPMYVVGTCTYLYSLDLTATFTGDPDKGESTITTGQLLEPPFFSAMGDSAGFKFLL